LLGPLRAMCCIYSLRGGAMFFLQLTKAYIIQSVIHEKKTCHIQN
jgi:hypothetical protein